MRHLKALRAWWSSEDASGVELSSLWVVVSGLFVEILIVIVWTHPGRRLAGTELLLQLFGAALGGPVIFAKFIRDPPEVSTADQVRVRMSEWARHALRRWRAALIVGACLLVLSFGYILLGSAARAVAVVPIQIPVWVGVLGTVIILAAWVAGAVPRRYRTPIASRATIFKPSAAARDPQYEAAATLVALGMIIMAYLLQFLDLYNVGPF